MSKSENNKNCSSSATHQSVQKSSTLNRKYVSRPTIRINLDESKETKPEAAIQIKPETKVSTMATLAEEPIPVEVSNPPLSPEEPLRSILQTPPENKIIERTEQIQIATAFSEPEEDKIEEVADTPDLPPEIHPYQKIINQVTAKGSGSDGEVIPPPTPRELKNEAIKKALRNLDEQKEDEAVSKVIATEKKQSRISKKQLKQKHKKSKQSRTLSDSFKKEKRHSSVSKFILAFATSAACIGVLGYFVSLNMPSISVRVAAMQTGIEASYPTYVPRDYQLSGVSTGDNSTVTLNFSGKDNDSFYITEEKSSWDSNALLNNYVKSEWDEDYTAVREQGVTLYIHNSDAVWVNGGILYKLKAVHGVLSKKVIKNIALSL